MGILGDQLVTDRAMEIMGFLGRSGTIDRDVEVSALIHVLGVAYMAGCNLPADQKELNKLTDMITDAINSYAEAP